MLRTEVDVQQVLDLTLDVDLLEGLAFCGFENLACLPGEKPELGVLLLEKILALVVADELCCIAV
jgi:hypothetical protein